MVNMFCSKQIWSTWPHCHTENCRRGRYDATDITNINTLAAARVSQGSHTLQKTQGNGLSMVNQGNLGDLPSSSGNFWKTAKSQGILREWVYMADLSVPGKITWEISHSPIHQGLIFATYTYPWWIGEWPAYTQIMMFTFTLWKSLCYRPKMNWCH